MSASEIAPLKVVTDMVTVVVVYAPAVAFSPVAIQLPPPRPAVLELSCLSNILARLAFVQALQLVATVALLLVDSIRTTKVLATVVVEPGTLPVVSLAAVSLPPAPVSHGLPEVVTSEKQWITPSVLLPESATTGAASPPTVNFQNTANREPGFVAAVPALCGDHVGTWTKPFAVVSVIAWFSDDTTSRQTSLATILAGYGGVIAPTPAVKVPEAR